MKLKYFIIPVLLLGLLAVNTNAAEYFEYFDITSGYNSPWAYSKYNQMKTVMSNRTSVNVQRTKSQASRNDQKFIYAVVNSNNEIRSSEKNQTGTGSFRFSKDNTAYSYYYWLGAKRDGGGVLAKYETTGTWSLDD